MYHQGSSALGRTAHRRAAPWFIDNSIPSLHRPPTALSITLFAYCSPSAPPEQPQPVPPRPPAGSKWSQHVDLLIQKDILALFGQIRIHLPRHNSAQFRTIVHTASPPAGVWGLTINDGPSWPGLSLNGRRRPAGYHPGGQDDAGVAGETDKAAEIETAVAAVMAEGTVRNPRPGRPCHHRGDGASGLRVPRPTGAGSAIIFTGCPIPSRSPISIAPFAPSQWPIRWYAAIVMQSSAVSAERSWSKLTSWESAE